MPFKSQAQQRMMFATQPKTAEKWAHETPNIKKLPQHVKKEGAVMHEDGVDPMAQTAQMAQGTDPMASQPIQIDEPADQYIHPGCDDQVGDIYVVLKPNADNAVDDILHKTHAFGVHQFDPQTVHGVYGDEGEANLVAEGAVKDLHKHLTTVEKKKDAILDKIAKHIHKLQKEINDHMKSANSRPEEAESHHTLAQRKMDIIKNLRDKHKLIKASKKELPKKEKQK